MDELHVSKFQIVISMKKKATVSLKTPSGVQTKTEREEKAIIAFNEYLSSEGERTFRFLLSLEIRNANLEFSSRVIGVIFTESRELFKKTTDNEVSFPLDSKQMNLQMEIMESVLMECEENEFFFKVIIDGVESNVLQASKESSKIRLWRFKRDFLQFENLIREFHTKFGHKPLGSGSEEVLEEKGNTPASNKKEEKISISMDGTGVLIKPSQEKTKTGGNPQPDDFFSFVISVDGSPLERQKLWAVFKDSEGNTFSSAEIGTAGVAGSVVGGGGKEEEKKMDVKVKVLYGELVCQTFPVTLSIESSEYTSNSIVLEEDAYCYQRKKWRENLPRIMKEFRELVKDSQKEEEVQDQGGVDSDSDSEAEPEEENMFLDDMPFEMILEIVLFLPHCDIPAFSRTCKYVSQVCRYHLEAVAKSTVDRKFASGMNKRVIALLFKRSGGSWVSVVQGLRSFTNCCAALAEETKYYDFIPEPGPVIHMGCYRRWF